MKATEILKEDDWFSDKLKRAGQRVASPVSSYARGALKARRRAAQLVDQYKEALGQGLGKTPVDLRNWLRQGEYPVAPTLIKSAAEKANLDLTSTDRLQVPKVRDFFVALAGEEARASGGTSPAFRQTKQQTQPKPKTAAGKSILNDPEAIDAIATAVAQKLK